MATLEEHRDNMTLFYSVFTGKIKSYCSGVQDMNYFGEDKVDYNYDFIVIPYDEYILRNTENFMIVDGELIFMQPQIGYKIKR